MVSFIFFRDNKKYVDYVEYEYLIIPVNTSLSLSDQSKKIIPVSPEKIANRYMYLFSHRG